MAAHPFVDETKHPKFVLVAAVVSSTVVNETRSAVAAMHLPGQRRIHFKDERTGRKQSVLRMLVEAPVSVRLYECGEERRELAARRRCLMRLVEDLADIGAERLVLELDESVLRHDQRVLYTAVQRAGLPGRLSYAHLRATQEPLLAVPDAVAWSWAKGGEWRQRVSPIVSAHVVL